METPTPNPIDPSPLPIPARTLEQRHEDLRKMFIAGLVGMLLMGMSLNYVLLRQLIFNRKDLDVVRPQVSQMVELYTKNEEPQIRGFVNSLIEYAKRQPDFNPILAKYRIVSMPSGQAPTGQAVSSPAKPSPAPSTNVAPKKK